ncbi:hypothetical protein LAZ67_3001795 [Cordylochernes scorpioides]|uniref:CCHC-type domain-containing protein n=1 Tax=Cordylochernes scorpioides TaxID=51811 RepID=A0ABY6K7I0_9ARAC|nr:hypothetical protein LAZ67_3001795 [Cordylochernes scorpioides]
MSRTATNLVWADSPFSAEQMPGRHGQKAHPCAEKSANLDLQNKSSINIRKTNKYANPPAGAKDANSATSVDSAFKSPFNGVIEAQRTWANSSEDVNPASENGFTVVKGKKRRRGSAESPEAAAHSSNARRSGTNHRQRTSTERVPRAQEIKTTRTHIVEARARQASSTEEHCLYIEHCPELEPYHYLKAIDEMVGGTSDVVQTAKVNGHLLLGLSNKTLAERLINEGLEVEGMLLKTFPFYRRAAKITIGNLPFFVKDASVIDALLPYGRITSIVPKQLKAGKYLLKVVTYAVSQAKEAQRRKKLKKLKVKEAKEAQGKRSSRKETEAAVKCNKVKDSETKPKGDGVNDSEAKPKGDGVKESEAKPKGEGVKESEVNPRDEGIKDSEDEPKGDGVSDAEARPTGDTESKIKNKGDLQKLKGNPGDWLSRWGQFDRNNANEKYEETNLKDKEDSEAKPKGDGVKDSETAIKGYESVNNSKAVAEGTDLNVEEKLNVEQGTDLKVEEKLDAEQGTDSKVEEENLDAEQGTESKVEEKIIYPKDWFKSESRATPIRPVFGDASCRGHGALALRRYLKRRPILLRRIPEIGIKLRKNKYGVLADMGRYFQVMAIKENDWDYLRFLLKRKMDAYRAIFGGVCGEGAASLPARLDIRIKGEAWPMYLTSGIRCSRCQGQGHRRANCPLLHGQSTTSRRASPPSTTNLPPLTTHGLPGRSSAAPTAPAPPSPALGPSGAPPDARIASLPSTAPRPSTPALPASFVQVAAPAPPPEAPAPEHPASPRSAATEPTPPARPDFTAPCGPLPAQGTLGPATHIPDVDMTTTEETCASSPAAVIPTLPLPAPRPAGPTPPVPHEKEILQEQEDIMIIKIFRKLKHMTCLKPLYDSGFDVNDLRDASLFTEDRASLMTKLSPALKGVLAEFLGTAIELARGYHPDAMIIMAMIILVGDDNPGHDNHAEECRWKPSLGSESEAVADLSAENHFQGENSRMADASANYANLPIDRSHANFAAACIADVTPSTSGALAAATNWAEQMEAAESGQDAFTEIKHKRRRRESPSRPIEQRSSGIATSGRTGATPRGRPPAGRATEVQVIRATRADIADARARQRSSTEDNCVFVEHCPDFGSTHYLQAVEELVGGAGNVLQVMKMDGHMLVGLSTKALAERLIRDGLDIGHIHLRAFPFKKRAERITVGNLPFFVDDAAVIEALKPYGDVTSIVPIRLRAGRYTFTDGRREAFILLKEGIALEKIPTRVVIRNKGNVLPAFISYGVKCSRCGRQSHRRANCPIIPGRASNNGEPQPVPHPPGASSTVSRQPNRPTLTAPAPSPKRLAPQTTVSGTSAALPTRTSSDPVAPPPARPDFAAPRDPLPAQRTLGPAAPTPDVEMSIVEETSASSTSAAKNATRVDLDEFIERHPSVSFAGTDALGLGREDVLDLLSSRTKAQRKGPLLSPPQCDALAGLIRQILDLRPGAVSNLYKVLGQVRAELRTTPAAVPPTPPLPAPRPAEPMPPTAHREELTPPSMTPPPPAWTDMEEDDPMTEEALPAPRPAEPTPPAPQEKESTPTMATPPPPPTAHMEDNPALTHWKMSQSLYHIFIKEPDLGPTSKSGIEQSDLADATLDPRDREDLIAQLLPRQRTILAQLLGALLERSLALDPFLRGKISELRASCLPNPGPL